MLEVEKERERGKGGFDYLSPFGTCILQLFKRELFGYPATNHSLENKRVVCTL